MWNNLLSLQTQHSKATALAAATADTPVRMDWTNVSEMKRHTTTSPRKIKTFLFVRLQFVFIKNEMTTSLQSASFSDIAAPSMKVKRELEGFFVFCLVLFLSLFHSESRWCSLKRLAVWKPPINTANYSELKLNPLLISPIFKTFGPMNNWGYVLGP